MVVRFIIYFVANLFKLFQYCRYLLKNFNHAPKRGGHLQGTDFFDERGISTGGE